MGACVDLVVGCVGDAGDLAGAGVFCVSLLLVWTGGVQELWEVWEIWEV